MTLGVTDQFCQETLYFCDFSEEGGGGGGPDLLSPLWIRTCLPRKESKPACLAIETYKKYKTTLACSCCFSHMIIILFLRHIHIFAHSLPPKSPSSPRPKMHLRMLCMYVTKFVFKLSYQIGLHLETKTETGGPTRPLVQIFSLKGLLYFSTFYVQKQTTTMYFSGQ